MDNLDEFLAVTPEEGGSTSTADVAADAAANAIDASQSAENASGPVVGETEEQKATRERDEKGRFKAKEAEEPVMVPLKALHETRDELKALKAELDSLRAPQQQPQAQPVPDIFENPEGYAAHLQNQIAQTTLNDRLNLSEELVRQSAGDETVNAAQEWGRQMLAANPMFAQTFYAQRNPYGFLVGEYKRSQTLSQLGNADPTEVQAFLAWKEAQSKAQAQPPAQAAQPAIPSTLADAQSARGATDSIHVPTFDEILRRT